MIDAMPDETAESYSVGGFTPNRKTYVLDFADDPELTGLEVRARAVPLGVFLDMVSLAETAERALVGKVDGKALSTISTMLTSFAGVLVDWNIRDETGAKVPPTLEGLRSQDTALVFGIVRAWMQASGGVSGPLGGGSNNGSQSVGALVPMEPLSQSPTN